MRKSIKEDTSEVLKHSCFSMYQNNVNMPLWGVMEYESLIDDMYMTWIPVSDLWLGGAEVHSMG